ncbi:MAG: hypothetical protein ACHQ49_09020 [Elusimicrobiota bacterium]
MHSHPTATKERSGRLLANKASIQPIIDKLPAILHVKDAEGRYVLVNRSSPRAARRRRRISSGGPMISIISSGSIQTWARRRKDAAPPADAAENRPLRLPQEAQELLRSLTDERAILLRLTDAVEEAWRRDDERAPRARRSALIVLHRALALHAEIEDIVFSGRPARGRAAARIAAAVGARRETIRELRGETERLLDRLGPGDGDELKPAATAFAQFLRSHLRLDETPWPLLSVHPGRFVFSVFARAAADKVRALASEVSAYERVIAA